jgi:hypothetical protein
MDRKTIPSRRGRNWIVAGVTLLLLLVAGYFGLSGQVPFLTPVSTPSPSPSPAPTRIQPTETLSASPIPPAPVGTLTATSEPTIPGGADQIAFLAGNQLYFMNIDGSGLVQIRTDNSPKSNLQWIPGNRLVYISRNCAFIVDGETKREEELVCFNLNETLEGFRVSPDARYAAISIQRTLNVFPFDIAALNEMDTRFNLTASRENCFYNQFPFRDVLWSNDGSRIAARIVDTELVNSDQIFLLSVDIPNCANTGVTRIDKFPGLNFGFTNTDSTKKITSFDWNGGNRFLLNDSVRNDGFGDLYLYDSETRQETIINPIDGVCCYRDARWSPDGKYIMFVFQRYDSREVSLYFSSLEDIEAGRPLTPIELPAGFLLQRDKPQPALRPIN